MELKEVYERVQGNYDGVMGRLLTEDRVKKFLIKFLDNDMSLNITNALDANDYETAFREAHTLKGVCANLGLDKLQNSSSDLTESLRNGKPDTDITSLVEAMKADYKLTVEVLNTLKS